MPHASVAGRSVHYIRRGEGEPLLLIMGLAGHHLHWGEPFLEALERHFDVIALDNRGMGHSQRADEPFTLVDLADDAVGLLDELGIETAHVMGISMGGMIAQEVALRHPERVRTLTLGCTMAGGAISTPTSPEVFERLTAVLASGDFDKVMETMWALNVSGAFAENREAYGRLGDIARELPSPIPVQMLQIQAIQGHDTGDRLPEISVPTLVIHGTEDQMLPYQNAEPIAKRIPGARLEILDDVGHLFFWELPEESAQMVREHALGARAQTPAQ